MKVVFYGARQAEWLCWIYRNLSGSREDAVWVDGAAQLELRQEAIVSSADLLAVQVNGTPLPASFDEITARIERVRFPELALDFLWPFGGQPHLNNSRNAVFPLGPFPVELGDAWINRRLSGRQLGQAIEAEYLALDVAKVVDLDLYRKMALQRQADLDLACGEDFASRLEAGFKTEQLFDNPTTPGPELLRMLANRLFGRMRAPFALGEEWRSESQFPELPIHPSVAKHFDLAFAQGRRYRAWGGDRVDFEEYLRRYLAFAEGPELEAGIKLAADGEAAAALPLLERGTRRPMGQSSVSGRRALARAFVAGPGEAAAALRRAGAPEDDDLLRAAGHFAAARWSEAQAAALARLQKGSISAELHIFIALVRERLGDKDGRVASLRSALALRPRDHELHSRLARALSASGDTAGAIASAEAEVGLNPRNPHARAFLAHLWERSGQRERAKAELQRALELVAAAPEYAALRKVLAQRRTDLDATPVR